MPRSYHSFLLTALDGPCQSILKYFKFVRSTRGFSNNPPGKVSERQFQQLFNWVKTMANPNSKESTADWRSKPISSMASRFPITTLFSSSSSSTSTQTPPGKWIPLNLMKSHHTQTSIRELRDRSDASVNYKEWTWMRPANTIQFFKLSYCLRIWCEKFKFSSKNRKPNYIWSDAFCSLIFCSLISLRQFFCALSADRNGLSNYGTIHQFRQSVINWFEQNHLFDILTW